MAHSWCDNRLGLHLNLLRFSVLLANVRNVVSLWLFKQVKAVITVQQVSVDLLLEAGYLSCQLLIASLKCLNLSSVIQDQILLFSDVEFLVKDHLIGGIFFVFQLLELLFDNLEVVSKVLQFEVLFLLFGVLDGGFSGSDSLFEISSLDIPG